MKFGHLLYFELHLNVVVLYENGNTAAAVGKSFSPIVKVWKPQNIVCSGLWIDFMLTCCSFCKTSYMARTRIGFAQVQWKLF